MNLGVDMTFPLVFHQKELEVSFPGLNAGGGGGVQGCFTVWDSLTAGALSVLFSQ